MANIKYDSTIFDSVIKSGVSSGKSYFNQAQVIANGYSCPSDFSYSNSIYDIKNQISNVINRLKKFEQWIEQVENYYDQVIENNQDDIKKIEIIEIKRRIPPTIS